MGFTLGLTALTSLNLDTLSFLQEEGNGSLDFLHREVGFNGFSVVLDKRHPFYIKGGDYLCPFYTAGYAGGVG